MLLLLLKVQNTWYEYLLKISPILILDYSKDTSVFDISGGINVFLVFTIRQHYVKYCTAIVMVESLRTGTKIEYFSSPYNVSFLLPRHTFKLIHGYSRLSHKYLCTHLYCSCVCLWYIHQYTFCYYSYTLVAHILNMVVLSYPLPVSLVA
jgi:hypothetical protein